MLILFLKIGTSALVDRYSTTNTTLLRVNYYQMMLTLFESWYWLTAIIDYSEHKLLQDGAQSLLKVGTSALLDTYSITSSSEFVHKLLQDGAQSSWYKFSCRHLL